MALTDFYNLNKSAYNKKVSDVNLERSITMSIINRTKKKLNELNRQYDALIVPTSQSDSIANTTNICNVTDLFAYIFNVTTPSKITAWMTATNLTTDTNLSNQLYVAIIDSPDSTNPTHFKKLSEFNTANPSEAITAVEAINNESLYTTYSGFKIMVTKIKTSSLLATNNLGDIIVPPDDAAVNEACSNFNEVIEG